MFQSTFPQGERPVLNGLNIQDFIVSIHVPARGTTGRKYPRGSCSSVSIHVPARGTTGHIGYAVPESLFQSTFPQGERQYTTIKRVHNLSVSIHVPARGTTQARMQSIVTQLFQSTFPQGERRLVAAVAALGAGFNPRSRKGNDHSQSFYAGSPSEFQSTFPQGERRGSDKNQLCFRIVSIHVPARGTTENKRVLPITQKFQSTFPQGERLIFSIIYRNWQKFQSTFPQGERLHKSDVEKMTCYVSIHVPARGTTNIPRFFR